MRRSALLVLTMVLAAAPGAAAGASRDLGPADGPLLSDDTRFLTAQTGRVYDTLRRKWRDVAVPSGCQTTGLSRHQMLFTCEDFPDPFVRARGVARDLLTGEQTALPDADVRVLGELNSALYVELGDRWAQVAVDGNKVFGTRLLSRADGSRTDGPRSRRQVLDLDRADATRTLCRPVRTPLQPQFIDLVPGSLVRAGRRYAAVTYAITPGGGTTSSVVLQACGRRAQTIRRCPELLCSQVTMDARTLAWTETERPSAAEPTTRIRIRSLRTGRTRTLTRLGSPQIRLVRGQLYVTGRRLRAITP